MKSKNLLSASLFLALLTTCDNGANGISKLEASIDSIEVELDTVRSELRKTKDSLAVHRELISRSELASGVKTVPRLGIPLFINQRVNQIKKYWETRISVEHFEEGTFDDT